MIDAAVNVYVSPADMKALMAGTETAMPDGLESGDATPTAQATPAGSAADVQLSYKTPNLLVISAKDTAPPHQTIKFSFERSNVVDWKLSAISLHELRSVH
jgi:hypothetical protein